MGREDLGVGLPERDAVAGEVPGGDAAPGAGAGARAGGLGQPGAPGANVAGGSAPAAGRGGRAGVAADGVAEIRTGESARCLSEPAWTISRRWPPY